MTPLVKDTTAKIAAAHTLSLPCSIADRYEHKIAGAVVDALLAAKPFHHIAVWDGEGMAYSHATRDVATIMAALASTDHDRLYVYASPCNVDTEECAALGYVLLIYGNGQGLISDWYPGSDTSWLTQIIDPLLSILDN